MYVTNIVIIPFQTIHNTNQLKLNQVKSKQNLMLSKLRRWDNHSTWEKPLGAE